MAAPVPVALIPLYATFRIVILNLKNVTDIEISLKKLVLLNFNIKMAHDFALKRILENTPVDEELEDLKQMVIAKVEKLEARIAESKEAEVETPEDEDAGSSSDDSESDGEDSDDEDSDEPPAKKPCTSLEPVKPTAQKTFREVLATSKTAPILPKLTIKVPNPFAKRPPQPLATTPRNPRSLTSATSHPLEPVAQRPKLTIKVPNPFVKKSTQPLVPALGNSKEASLSSATALLSATCQTIEEYLAERKERNEEKKENAKVVTLDPCMKRPRPAEAPIKKYPIRRKPMSSRPAKTATPSEEDFISRKRTAPAKIVPKRKAPIITDHPVPLMSIVLERPGWMREEILNQY